MLSVNDSLYFLFINLDRCGREEKKKNCIIKGINLQAYFYDVFDSQLLYIEQKVHLERLCGVISLQNQQKTKE